MDPNLFPELNGKAITVRRFVLEESDGGLCARMTCAPDGAEVCEVTFEHLSRLRLDEVSAPFRIEGFEIADYGARGYERDVRYFVSDFEDGRLSFFCEDVAVSPVIE